MEAARYLKEEALIKGKPCNICAGREYFPLFSHHDNNYFVDKTRYDLIRCSNCGVVSIRNKPTPRKLKKYYESNYYSYDTASSIFFRMKNRWYGLVAKIGNRTLANRLLFGGLFILPRHSHAKALDLGCGDGTALLFLRELGFKELFGTEINKAVCQKLEAKGVTSFCTDDVTTLKNQRRMYDLIRMSHVLEHLYNPRETLKFLNDAMVPRGDLLIGVPNFNSPAARIFGRYFCGLQLPTHLYHFNKDNLKELLERQGFEVKKIATTGFSGISNSILTLTKDRWGKRKIPGFVTIILILGLVPLEVLLNITGQGYIINIHAVKS